MSPFPAIAYKGGTLGWTWRKTWAAVRSNRVLWDLEAAKYVARDAWQDGRAKAGLSYVAIEQPSWAT